MRFFVGSAWPAVCGILAIILSIQVILVDYFAGGASDALSRLAAGGMSSWIVYSFYALPYILYGVAFGFFVWGLAITAKNLKITLSVISFSVVAAGSFSHALLDFTAAFIAPSLTATFTAYSIPIAAIVAIMMCIGSVGFLYMRLQFGALAICTCCAGVLCGVSILFRVSDIPSIIFLAFGTRLLLAEAT